MIDIKDTTSIEHVADWIELSLAIEQGQLSKSDVAHEIEQISGDNSTETFLAGVWRELEYRQSLYFNSFFTTHNPLVEWSFPNQAPIEYITCLIFSLVGVQGNTQIPGRLFERIAQKAIKNYLCGEADILGWPPKQSVLAATTDETKLQIMVRGLGEGLHEKFIEGPASHFKDRGVDLVGWIPHYDIRANQVVLLLQCGAGLHWRTKKAVSIEAWAKYIHWATRPTPGMVVPCIIDEREWLDQSNDFGLLFDRVRLMNLLNTGLNDAGLESELKAWVEKQLEENTN